MSIRVRNPLELMEEHHQEYEDEDCDYEDSDEPDVVTVVSSRLKRQTRKHRKQQLERLDRDDQVTVVTTKQYLRDLKKQRSTTATEAAKPRKRPLKKKLYMLDPDDFPEDSMKQHQIRRAQMTHNHHEQQKIKIRSLQKDNEQMKREIAIYREKETQLKQLCVCGMAAKILAKSDILDSTKMQISPQSKNGHVLLKSTKKSESSSRNRSTLFSDATVLKPSSSANQDNINVSDSEPPTDLIKSAVGKKDAKPSITSEELTPTNKAPTKWFMIQKSSDGKNRLVKLPSPLSSVAGNIPYPTVPLKSKRKKSVKIVQPTYSKPLKKETTPAKLLQNTLHWMENLIKSKSTETETKLEIGMTDELVKYWSDDLVPLSFCSPKKSENASSPESALDIEAEEVARRLTRVQEQSSGIQGGREKRAVTRSRLSTNELLQNFPKRKSKVQVSSHCNKRKANENASGDSDDLQIDWDNCELQYLRPRKMYLTIH